VRVASKTTSSGGELPSVRVFADNQSTECLHEVVLEPSYNLCEMGLQQLDQYGKCHTVKIQQVQASTRRVQGRIQEFWKGGAVRGRSPESSAGGGSGGPPHSPENFEKLDATSCNLAYILRIRMASDIIQNWAFAEQKTVAATISIHTHAYTPHTSKNSSDFGHYKI